MHLSFDARLFLWISGHARSLPVTLGFRPLKHMSKNFKMENTQQKNASTNTNIDQRQQRRLRRHLWMSSQSAYCTSEVSRLFIFKSFIIPVENVCIILYPPKAHGFTTFTQFNFTWTRPSTLFIRNVVVFSCTFSWIPMPHLISLHSWVHRHPFWEPQVAPRRQSLSPECTEYHSLTCHAHTRGIFVVASACHSPPNEPDISSRPPLIRVWTQPTLFATTTAFGCHNWDT